MSSSTAQYSCCGSLAMPQGPMGQQSAASRPPTTNVPAADTHSLSSSDVREGAEKNVHHQIGPIKKEEAAAEVVEGDDDVDEEESTTVCHLFRS
ncbi:hypothetical protein GWI33_005653 [Rhynchophorus ferrugineus]|uniref:Uncharacterized protein n=1 Tax=Rhynchophorus ferrugineus TaxID=354439 RepID=A0A834IMN8_RHYFE|nr:hypothetical protein GWI33_005653 [Rhynchophorus ferrugineus]